MVEHDNATVRTVVWAEVFPWLKILRSFRVAIAARALVFGAVGLLLTAIGWWFVGTTFGTDAPATEWLQPFATCPWKASTAAVPDQPPLLRAFGDKPSAAAATPCGSVAVCPWQLLTAPAFQGLTHTHLSPSAVASVLLCGLWATAVWAFFGAAICRMAAVQLAADEQVGWGAALRYAARKWPAYFAAPMLPIGGVFLATVPVFILGLIMRANIGLLVAGVLWPLVLVAGLLMALLLLGTLFGWPLMWATISTEGTDSFDALSRTYAYVFQRPLHYLFYVLVAAVIGWLGWVLVENFAASVVWLGYWAAAWGCGSDQITAVVTRSDQLGGIGAVGAVLIRFFTDCVRLLGAGYLFSYFWSASAAVYLLLRRDVDAAEMDEVFLDADQSEESFGLPCLSSDHHSAPAAEGEADQAETAE
jgi:hypothetical protein